MNDGNIWTGAGVAGPENVRTPCAVVRLQNNNFIVLVDRVGSSLSLLDGGFVPLTCTNGALRNMVCTGGILMIQSRGHVHASRKLSEQDAGLTAWLGQDDAWTLRLASPHPKHAYDDTARVAFCGGGKYELSLGYSGNEYMENRLVSATMLRKMAAARALTIATTYSSAYYNLSDGEAERLTVWLMAMQSQS